jgi:ParB-like chromosome segregation protein Spo0J
MAILEELEKAIKASDNPMQLVTDIRTKLHELSPRHSQPIDYVRWVPIEKVQANDYNPNSVAKNEMKLLYTSISHDGYTQPVVTIYDESIDKYVIVDGFHRYTTMRTNKDLYDLNDGLLPIVVLNKDINDRMASTVRHNRARGKHSTAGMGQIVFNMLQNGMSDEDICKELGLEAEELIRLKHLTGFSKLFKDSNYGQAWETDKQIQIKKQFLEENPDERVV